MEGCYTCLRSGTNVCFHCKHGNPTQGKLTSDMDYSPFEVEDANPLSVDEVIDSMRSYMDEQFPGEIGNSRPSPELRLRRELAEDAIRKAVDAELSAQAGFEDPNIRDREMDKLWSVRLPNWETDDPPPLTPEQRAVLEKHITSGVCWPGSRASDELRGRPVARSSWGDIPPRCYAKRNGGGETKWDWCGSCQREPR